MENFKNLRFKLEKEVKGAKRKFYRNKFSACIGDSRQTYKLLNDLSGKNIYDANVPILESCQQHSVTPSTFDVAERFNVFFSEIGTQLKKDMDCLPLPPLKQVGHSMFLYQVTELEVEQIINKLDNKSSSGDDNINNILVKLSVSATVPYLTLLINKSFSQGIFPNKLKRAKVIPMHKSGSRVDENNYRPISLLIVWSKIFERAMYTRIYNYLEKFSLIYSRQFGFRSKHSTIDALVDFTEKMRSCGNQNVVTFFFGLKKAFDTIEHSLLLQKLESYGIRGITYDWFESYLKNRKQRVEINGVSSNWSSIKCGVPQGSILGPLLFLIYINDLPHVCKSSEVVLFADDTNVTALGQVNVAIENDISYLNYWLNANKLVINMDKTVQMNIKTSNSMTFQLNSCAIKTEPVCKYLGIYVDSKLSFFSQIDYVRMRLAKQSGIISKLRFFAPRHQLLDYYRTNIKSTIQYGILVYGCCSYSSLMPIYIFQRKILKLIYFRNRREQSDDIFIRNQLLTVHELHVYELLKFVLRSVNKLHSEDFLNNVFIINLRMDTC